MDAPENRHHGILVIDKPLGMSSMHVCRIVRRRLREGGAPKRVRVGHAGTLDPLATGVLVVLVGRATKRCESIMGSRKVYEARVDLSRVSTTDDGEGEITGAEVSRVPTRANVEACCAGFVGEIEQAPPAHSALWVGGRRAYEIARAGGDPGLKPRLVRVHACEVTGYEWPMAGVRVECGKGTYIRSLARDLGRRLGTGGMLAGLRRTRVGEFTAEEAVDPDALPGAIRPEDLRGG